MQTVWKQDAHVRKADGNKLDTLSNFMKSRSFDSKKKWNCVPTDINKCKIKNWKERLKQSRLGAIH
jgi:hypothetical protein